MNAASEKEVASFALVKSCTECNSEYIEGEPNIRAIVHKLMYSDEFGLNCRKCPVFLGMSDAEWGEIIEEMDGME